MLEPIYTCDRCKTPKRETNHWFALRSVGATLQILPFENSLPSDRHICGQACLIKAVTAFAGGVIWTSRYGAGSLPPSAQLGAPRNAPVLSSEAGNERLRS